MPAGSSARSLRRSNCCASRGSPTKRYAFASAAGPMNSGSTSVDRQSETHAPHWMHAIDCVTSTMFSCGTMYSRSGIGSLLMSHGVTRWIFFQWTASMSTIRSLITGMLPMGSTSMTPSRPPAWARSRCVWQARPGWPLMRTPHEPQIAARQEHRMPIDPSKRALAWRMPSSTERCGSRSTVCSSQYGASPDSGSYRRSLRVNSAMDSVLPLFGLPAGDRHRRVRDVRSLVPVSRQIDVLQPLVVVARGVVGAELRAARLLALDRGDDDRLGAVEHVAELDGAEHVLVEDRAAVVDVRGALLLLEAAHDLVGLAQPGLVAVHGHVPVHDRPEHV